MMKFIIFGLFVGLYSFLGLWSVWMIVGVLVLFYFVMSTNSFYLVDFIFYSLSLGMDMVSFSLIILSLWTSMLMYISSNMCYTSKISLNLFFIFVWLLFFVLILTFLSMNLFFFYFFFEASLIPTLLIIMGWGYQPERLQAGVYFLFYTMVASLPLLFFIFYYYNLLGEVNFSIMYGGLFLYGSFLMYFFMVFAFLVKMPMFMVHLWLPKAHVEAPVAGSMILAGVLLKLGGYGMYRVLYYVKGGLEGFGSYFFGLSVLGMVYVGFLCCRLTDLKALVAYSSVAHMGLVICGMFSYFYFGFLGSLMMMISHGVCSSGLFCAVNIYYERSGSRGFIFNKGFISVLPIFTLSFFMLCGANMAAPPTINLLSEISLMASIIKFDYLMLLFFPLGSYLGALFTLYLFSNSQHGKFFESLMFFSFINFREYHLMFVHLIPLNLILLKFDYFTMIY